MTATVPHSVMGILAVLLPPLAVGLARGFGDTFALNIVLSCCGYFPGIFHACKIVTGDEEAEIRVRERRERRGPVNENGLSLIRSRSKEDWNNVSWPPNGVPDRT